MKPKMSTGIFAVHLGQSFVFKCVDFNLVWCYLLTVYFVTGWQALQPMLLSQYLSHHQTLKTSFSLSFFFFLSLGCCKQCRCLCVP